jgi:aryl-alcohol dehydrogenase-like predicted oxidoreductase
MDYDLQHAFANRLNHTMLPMEVVKYKHGKVLVEYKWGTVAGLSRSFSVRMDIAQAILGIKPSPVDQIIGAGLVFCFSFQFSCPVEPKTWARLAAAAILQVVEVIIRGLEQAFASLGWTVPGYVAVALGPTWPDRGSESLRNRPGSVSAGKGDLPTRRASPKVSGNMTASVLATRPLGAHGPAVFPLALGCMGMSGMYGPSDETESLATLHEALDNGISLIDTGDFYGTGHNELLIGKALRGRRDKAILSVKFGALRTPAGGWTGVDARPAAVKNFLAYSLTRLGVDYVDIYRPARLDPNVPVEETAGAIGEMVKAGYVRYLGLSEMGADTVRRAHSTHPVTDLQIEYSIVSRGPEEKIFPVLAKLGIGVTAYGVLSRGLLSGSLPAGPSDFRAYLPRFSSGNREQNDRLAAVLREMAESKGATASQLAIAWVLSKGEQIVPVIGARTRKQLAEALGALQLRLADDEIARLEAAFPLSAIAGTRYDQHQMRILDSER